MIVVLILSFSSYDIRAEDTTCGQLLVTRCEECHYLSRVCQKLGKKSKWRWKRSMKVMVRHGAKINKAEQKKLIKCLAEQSPDVVAVCTTPEADKPFSLPIEKSAK